MKKTLSVLLLLRLSISLFAQNGTTAEEYNYIKNIYETQTVKTFHYSTNSYFMVELMYWESEVVKDIDVHFMALVSLGDNDLRALMVTIVENQKRFYIGVPNPYSNDSIITDYHLELSNLKKEYLVAFNMAYAEYLQKLPNYYPIAIKEAYYKRQKKTVSKKASFPDSRQRKPSKMPSHLPSKTLNNSVEIGGGLAGRPVKKIVRPKNDTGRYGTVVINICVGKDGSLVSASYTQKGSTTADGKLRALAEKAAKQMKFEAAPYAPDKQCGNITFKFRPV